MAGKKVKVKGTIKSVPNSKGKKPVNPRFSSGKGGLLTESIVINVKKNKGKNKVNKNKSSNE